MSRKSSSERTAPSSLTAGVCEGRRVLVVDADADTRTLYREALRVDGCDVVEAADGRDALTKALVRPPAIVITELRLPLLSEFAPCEILRRDRVTATVPIVVVTGEASSADLDQVHRIGANGVIVKPTTPDALLSAVRRLLSVGQLPNEPIAAFFGPARTGGNKRMALAKLHQRFATTTPPVVTAVAEVPILRSAADVRAEPYRRRQFQASRAVGRFRLSVVRQVRIPAPHAKVAVRSISTRRRERLSQMGGRSAYGCES